MGRLLPAFAACAIFGCQWLPACGAKPLAVLEESKGNVDRDHASARAAWESAAVGAGFEEGDAIRTGAGASAVVRLRAKGLLRLEENTIVRFSAAGAHREGEQAESESAPGIEVVQGRAALETGDEAMPIRTLFGTATLERGTRVNLTPGEKGVRFEIVMGSAAFQHQDGQRATLEAGDSIEVGIGMAVLEDAEGDGDQEPAAADAPGPERPAEPISAVVKGQVRQRGVGEAEWAALAEGETELDDEVELELDRGSSVEVARGAERATLHGEGRYRVGGAGRQLVDALDGRLSVAADEQDVRVRVPGGTIVARAVDGGTRADLTVEGSRTTVKTLSGAVATEGGIGERELAAGDESVIQAGAEGAEEDEGATEEGDEGAAQTLVDKEGYSQTLERAEVSVPAGQSFRIYDPAPPVAVGFVIDKCKEGVELRLRDGRRARGQGQINLPFNRGLHHYALHCLRAGEVRSRADATGKFRVLKSGGTAKLPTSAPDNDVATDGRNYTVMYQNIKPRVNVHWPKAPRSASYELHVKSARGADRKFSGTQPKQALPNTLLADGKNQIFFTTKEGKRSPVTTVELVFDNAAPTASIRKPPVAGFEGGRTTAIAGVAVTGSKVSVGDTPIPLDAQSRFEATVPLAPDQRALAIRFQHPRHGVRYYVRRRAGAPR
jgi:hypothetical protein